jgi:Family of unknown function (DUF6498)
VDPKGQTSSSAQRQIRPPPVSQHLHEFAANPHAWAVLGRNLIPVVGIYVFGWSTALAAFNYWFDGLTALAAIIAAMVPRALRESAPATPDGTKREQALITKIFGGIFTWVVLMIFVGLPYWIVLIPLHSLLLGKEVQRALAESPLLWLTFGSLASGHFWKAFSSGYDTMPDKELRQRARWDVYLLVIRAVAMFLMAAHGLGFLVVPFMALVLTYLEIWPERALGAVFGDPKRLWEYETEEERRSKKER